MISRNLINSCHSVVLDSPSSANRLAPAFLANPHIKQPEIRSAGISIALLIQSLDLSALPMISRNLINSCHSVVTDHQPRQLDSPSSANRLAPALLANPHIKQPEIRSAAVRSARESEELVVVERNWSHTHTHICIAGHRLIRTPHKRVNLLTPLAVR